MTKGILMVEKYEDLAETIHEQSRYSLVRPALILIRSVLHWLDAHRDQAPGRTITESELHDVQVHNGFSGTDRRFRNVMRDLGITVVPAPKPTNVEKWEKFIRESNPGLSESDVEDMAAHLDQFSVKAPGGDDE